MIESDPMKFILCLVRFKICGSFERSFPRSMMEIISSKLSYTLGYSKEKEWEIKKTCSAYQNLEFVNFTLVIVKCMIKIITNSFRNHC